MEIVMVTVVIVLGIFLLHQSKNRRNHLTTVGFYGLTLSLIFILGGCSLLNQDKNTTEDNFTSTSTEKYIVFEGSSDIKFKIGETKQRECWTQTFIYPNNIDDTFVIDVCLPDDYDESITYPVVYLTDCYWRRGDYEAMKELYQSGKTKEFILIGIGYPDDYNFDQIRVRDLVNEPEKFLSLIVNGVIPYIEGIYPIDAKDRTFCGASYGGFFMVYSLLQSDGLTKDVFKNYILASPTFWQYTGDFLLTDYEELYSERTDILNANVYLTVGGDEGEFEYLEPISSFVTQVLERGYNGLNLTYKVYEGKDHYTVWVPALLDGLKMYLAK